MEDEGCSRSLCEESRPRLSACLTLPIPFPASRGDTLWYLAERFDTSVEALLALNGIADRDLLLETSVLLIPPPREASEDVSSPAPGLEREVSLG